MRRDLQPSGPAKRVPEDVDPSDLLAGLQSLASELSEPTLCEATPDDDQALLEQLNAIEECCSVRPATASEIDRSYREQTAIAWALAST